MSVGWVSYRNGKYQGQLSPAGQRHGVGVAVDDDLTFHVSHWQEDRMQGPTLVYLAHARYIYGDWKDNEPHGLNVYRSGDTVLLSKYVFGVPAHRCLLINERHGLGCVLAEQGRQWSVLRSAALVSHGALMQLVELLQVEVPDRCLSLIKYACAFSHSHSALRTFPCHQNNCYFGFVNGLAIVFNSNNGLVSVGLHRNEQLCEFGGRFEAKRACEEGNFAPNGETIRYTHDRPAARIQQIYQKLHRRDANFRNENFESKTKVFASIHSLIINKLKHIVEEARTETIPRFDLNESLDYQERDEHESLKLDQLRDKMYSPPKKAFEKPQQHHAYTPSKAEAATSHSLLKKSIKPTPIQVSASNAKEQKIARNTPARGDRQRQSEFAEEARVAEGRRARERAESAQLLEKCNAVYTASLNRMDEAALDPEEEFVLPLDAPGEFNQLQETSSFKRILEEEAEEKKAAGYIRKSSKAQLQREEPPIQPKPYKKREKSIEELARPTYESIEERRKRILRDFQELNGAPAQTTPKREKPKPAADSPYQDHLISLDKEDQSSFGYMPLSLSNRINLRRDRAEDTAKEREMNREDKVKEKSLRESTQEEKSRSSTRRALYNYAVESRALPENREPAVQAPAMAPAAAVTPVRQKRTYQYMYE